jgi:hypothetical protein
VTESAETAPPAFPYGFAPMLLVSFLSGMAINFNLGAYSEGALTFVLIALGVVVFSLTESAKRVVSITRGSRFLYVIVWLGLVGMAFYAWNDEPFLYPWRPWDVGRKAQKVVLVLLATYLPFLTGRWREPKGLRLLRFGAFAAAVALAGADAIRASPMPSIDVWTVQQAGAAALLAGENPYTTVAEADSGPRLAADVPYVYPPTQLYLTLPAYALAKDVRFTMLAALLIAGLGMRFITGRARTGLPSIVEDAPALYLWLMTKLFLILEQSWIDPVQLMLITLACVAHVVRRSTVTAVLVGVILSAKQTMFWAAGLSGVILRFDRKQWAITVAVAVTLVFPFVWLDFRALKHANFDFLTNLPSRSDALTFNSWYLRRFGAELPGSAGFLLAGLVAAFSAWRLRGSVGRLGIAVTGTYFFFFTFNKWAFANYYFIISGLAALAAAASFHLTRPLTAAP